jgi:hypothetical protein
MDDIEAMLTKVRKEVIRDTYIATIGDATPFIIIASSLREAQLKLSRDYNFRSYFGNEEIGYQLSSSIIDIKCPLCNDCWCYSHEKIGDDAWLSFVIDADLVDVTENKAYILS